MCGVGSTPPAEGATGPALGPAPTWENLNNNTRKLLHGLWSIWCLNGQIHEVVELFFNSAERLRATWQVTWQTEEMLMVEPN